MAEKSKTRIVWEQMRASEGRTSWARTFAAVVACVGAKAFTNGEYLPDGCEVDLEVGTLVIEVIPTGSVKNGSREARFYRVGAEGLEPVGESFDWFCSQLSAQDFARSLLAAPVVATEAEEPGGQPPAQELAQLVTGLVTASERGNPAYLRVISEKLFSRENWDRMVELAVLLRAS